MANNNFDVNQYIQDNAQPTSDSFDLNSYINENQHLLNPSSQTPIVPQEDTYTPLESGLRGTANGALMGFEPALVGGVEALGKKAVNPNQSLVDLYRQYRDIQNSKNQAAQEQNPKSYLAGNIVGGIGGAAGLSEMGLLANGMKGAAQLGAMTGLGTSQADLTKGQLGQAAVDTGMGAGLGLLGGKLAEGVSNVLNPDKLETAGSKVAQDIIGINPKKDIPVSYDPEAGRVIKQYGETKGFGTAAMDNGALPLSGNPQSIASKAQDAITAKFKQLKPIIDNTQAKLDNAYAQGFHNNSVGSLDDKIANFQQQFFKNLPDIPQTQALKKMLVGGISPNAGQVEGVEQLENEGFFTPRINQIISHDGDLKALMADKQKLYQDAVAAAKNVYKSPDAYATENTGSFLKGLAQVVKQHTEDLASSIDPDAGKQIQQINGSISKLISVQEAAEKQLGRSSGSTLDKLTKPLQMGAQMGESALAHGLNKASQFGNAISSLVSQNTPKVVSTGLGTLVQKGIPQATASMVRSPTTQGFLQSFMPGYEPLPENEEPSINDPFAPQNNDIENLRTKTNPESATGLYSLIDNATPESLKTVAQNLQQQPGMQYVGAKLEQAADSNDQWAKRQGLFQLLQTQKGRQLLMPK